MDLIKIDFMIEDVSLKVAMVVHNSVVSDARVRKQALTLHNNGVDLELYGYGDNIDTKEINSIPLHVVKRVSALHLLKKWIDIPEILKKNLKSLKNKIKTSLFNIPFNLSVLFLFIVNYYYFGLLGLTNLVLLVGGVVLFIQFGLFFLSLFSVFFRYFMRNRLPKAYELIAKQIYDELIKTKFDVIHAHDIIGLMVALKVKFENPNVKLIWDAHELYTEVSYAPPVAASFINKVIKKSAGHIDYFTTISDSFIDYYKQKYPQLPDATLLMNATRHATEMRRKSDKLCNATGLNEDQNILLFQGGLAKERGITQLLEAAPKLPLNWSVVFMGNGPMDKLILQACEQYNVGPRVDGCKCIELIPPAPYNELAEWTSGATLGCIPYENTSLNHLYCTPNKLWEYPNAGVPILATELVEITKMIEKYKTGILLPQDYVSNDIVRAIKSVSHDQLEEMKNNCVAFNKVQNWEKYEPGLIKIYQDMKVI